LALERSGELALTAIATTDDDIRQLRSAVRGMLGIADPDAVPAPDPAWRAGWPALVELGATGFCVPEEKGGFGLEVRAAAATATELGAALHGSPYAALTASAHALAAAGVEAADEVLAGVLTGASVCGYAVLDPAGTSAWVVDGAPEVDALVLVGPGTGGLTLLADPSTWSVELEQEPFDVSRTSGRVVVDPGAGVVLPADPVAADLHRLLLAADAVGGMQKVLDRTVAHAGQRVAFGKPIGGFQAVHHRLADHAVRARGMALLVAEAAALLAEGSDAASRYVAMASVSVTANAPRILHDLLQLTGGIGFTWEYGSHFHERRVHQDARLGGGPRGAVGSLVEIEGWTR
jgi:alkylation response protein AidB-like acyl-CoA dehydrogenase